MNEETEKALSALAGGGEAAKAADATDWKAKFEEAQKALNSARVEQGRVKKLDERNKELEAELARLSKERSEQAALAGLPDELKEELPESMQKGASIIATNAVRAAMAERDAEMARLKEQMAERDRRSAEMTQARFAEQIEKNFPGFLKSAVLDSGDKHAAWVQYQRYNAGSINAAVKSCDFDTLSWHIRKFYTDELGIAAPSGGTGAAAPAPRTFGGGLAVAPKNGRKSTDKEIDELFDKKEAARERCDWAEMKRLTAEINRVQAEAGA